MNLTRSISVFDEALKQFSQKNAVGSKYRTADWREVPLAIRQRAFFSAGLESERISQSMRDYIESYLAGESTTSRADFVAEMRRLLIKEGVGKMLPNGEIDPKIDNMDLTDLRSLRRLQLIFDTNVEAARSHAQWQEGQDEDLLWVWPAQRFVRVRPVGNPRIYHEDALGNVRRKDDLPYWLSLNPDFGVPYGPWGFESGCGVEDVDRDEAVKLGLISADERLQPQKQALNQHFAASVAGLKGDASKRFVDYCKKHGMTVIIDATKATIKPELSKAPKQLATPKTQTSTSPNNKPTSAQQLLDQVGISMQGKVTVKQAKQLKDLISAKHHSSIKNYAATITGDHDDFTIDERIDFMNEFIGMLDKPLLDSLPKLQSITESFGDESIKGAYNPYDKTVKFHKTCKGHTSYHELIHWVHLNHPNKALVSDITAYFKSRTKGQKYLPNTTVIPDDFDDGEQGNYAGKIYEKMTNGDIGLELPTRHLEKLSMSPRELARFLNYRSKKTGNLSWREAFIKCLPLLYL